MPLTVLNVAYPFAPVGPDAVGGAEQVLTALDAALVRAGHRSRVIASAGSVTAGTLIETPRWQGVIDDALRQAAHAAHSHAIAAALAREPIDLIHLHGIDFPHYLPPPGVPVLVTLHLPPSWYPSEIFALERPDTWLHAVSAAQHRACPPGSRRLLPPIANGVDPGSDVNAHAHGIKRRFAMALGRLCPEKGFHHALEAARQADIPLALAGAVFRYPEHEDYVERAILPRLDRRRRLIGVVGPARKRRLLTAAQCLLVPSLAPETSSLVAMEALACGTPVIAFPAGALTDIVEHGRTGFLVHDERAMAEAIAAARGLDPTACRAAARERFSGERMVAEYLERYGALSGQNKGDASLSSLPDMPDVMPDVMPDGGRTPVRNVSSLAAAETFRSEVRPPTGKDQNKGSPPPLVIEDIHTVEALQTLAPEWIDLWRRAATATPFQAPAWLIPWWRHFGDGAVLRTVALRAHGRLVGLVPLLLYRKRLLPLGSDTSDYLDALLDDSLGPEALGAVFTHLDRQTDWTVCDLPDLPAGSPLLDAPVPAGWTDRRTEHDVCPLLALPATLDALPGTLPSTIARKLRMYRRRAAAAGTVTVVTAGPDDAAALFDTLVDLHAARWQARGESGVLDDPDALAFHRDAAPAMAALGALRLSALQLDGRTIAVIYGFAAQRRVCYYLQGFDPAFAELGPGNLIVGHAIEAAVREGATAFDFLRGSEDYKYRWGARDQVTWRRRLGRPQRRHPAA